MKVKKSLKSDYYLKVCYNNCDEQDFKLSSQSLGVDLICEFASKKSTQEYFLMPDGLVKCSEVRSLQIVQQ